MKTCIGRERTGVRVQFWGNCEVIERGAHVVLNKKFLYTSTYVEKIANDDAHRSMTCLFPSPRKAKLATSTRNSGSARCDHVKIQQASRRISVTTGREKVNKKRRSINEIELRRLNY